MVKGLVLDDQIKEIIQKFQHDRVGFVRAVFDIEPDPLQAQALRALDTNDHVTVRSGHGCGKSAVQAWCIWHYLCTRYFPKVSCTAPSKHQLYDVLWAELSKWHRRMNPVFRNQFEWTKEKVFHVDYPDEWFAVARTATKENPDALQGIHADYVFLNVDEASGVPEAIFEVSEGATGTIETKNLMCGNPTKNEGTFFRSHTKDQDMYATLAWSCLDSTITPAYYAPRMESKYGKDSNIYRVRVLGEFPKTDSESFIPFGLAADAQYRDIGPQGHLPIVYGLDVARFGDDSTVLAIRQGDEFKKYHILQGKGTMEVVNYVAALANKDKPVQIYVDVIGVGAGVFDRLEELGFPVFPVNVSESPAMKGDQYNRLRDELWGNFREWLEMRRGKIWDNETSDLVAELTAPRYKITHGGLIVIETKDDMKKRGYPSPNIADAHIMTFAQPMSEYTKPDTELAYAGHGEDSYHPFDSETGY